MRELRARGHEVGTPQYVVHPGDFYMVQWRLDRGLPDADVYVFQMPHEPLMLRVLEMLQAIGRRVVVELDDYLLFADEAPMPEKFETTSGIKEQFERYGPWDRRGRS